MNHPDSEFTGMDLPDDWDDDEAWKSIDWDERIERKALDHLEGIKEAGQRMQNDHPYSDGTGSYALCWGAVFMFVLIGIGWLVEKMA